MKTSRQVKMRFPDLEREERRDILWTCAIIGGCVLLTVVTVLALLGTIPTWIFPIPFTSVTVCAVISIHREAKRRLREERSYEE